MKWGERLMTLGALLFGLIASGTLFLAVATDFWLFTIEPVDPSLYNLGAENMTMDPDVPGSEHVDEPEDDTGTNETILYGLPKIKVHSGLWRACVVQVEGMPTKCTVIAYTEQQWGKRVQETDTTNSIFRAIRVAAPVIVFSLLVLLIAVGVSTLGNVKRDHKTLVGAVIYICAALCLATGVILYISAVNDEVSHRKKPKSKDEKFHYEYGWAFFFAGTAFMTAMVAAVLNIYVYLRRYTSFEDMIHIIPGLGSRANYDYSRGTEKLTESEVATAQSPTIIL